MEVGANFSSNDLPPLRWGPRADGDCLYCSLLRRPTDGRCGENPNRFYSTTIQFEVVIKPSPENIRELYLPVL